MYGLSPLTVRRIRSQYEMICMIRDCVMTKRSYCPNSGVTYNR